MKRSVLAVFAALVAFPSAASAQFADPPSHAIQPLMREDAVPGKVPTTCAELNAAYAMAAGEVLELLARSHAPVIVQEAAANTGDPATLLALLEVRQEDVAHRRLAETLEKLDRLPIAFRCSA